MYIKYIVLALSFMFVFQINHDHFQLNKMKCKNTIEGEICGAEIPTSAKWCGFCGEKVKVEDDTSFYLNKTCPVCSAEVTKRHKFCTECGWKVDPSLFQPQKISCRGKTEDGKICGADLMPSDKFCAECGTVKIKPLSSKKWKDFETVH